MEKLRELISIIVFIASISLIASSLNSEFEWLLFVLGLFCIVTAYFVWPSKRRGKREGDSIVLDIIEIIIELPVEFFMGSIRFLGRVIRGIFSAKGDGFDIDL
jgi:hypothetical protein